tara:strand:- start:204 stop:416 length:213 start_codon:yes stop_codon:yes gene_type:complete
MEIEKALQIIIEEAEQSIKNSTEVSMAKNEALALSKQLMSFIRNLDDQLMAQAPKFIPTDMPQEISKDES